MSSQIATARGLIRMLHKESTAADAAAGLDNIVYRSDSLVKTAILAELAAQPLPPGPPGPNLELLLKRLQIFDSFYTVCAGGDDASQALSMVLAPDESGRRLVAAFTAQDALQQFVAASSSGGAVSLVSARLSGKELFEQVASTNDLDGIVFNASGPGQPIPLSRDAAYAVLKG